MTRKSILICLVFTVLFPFASLAQRHGRPRAPRPTERREPIKPDSAFVAKFAPYTTSINGMLFQYRVASIGNFDREPPILVIYLHGRSASGSDNERQLAKEGVKKLYDYLSRNNISAYLFVPQCPENRRWNERVTNGRQMTSVLKLAIDEFFSQHMFNTNKVFIFGDSSGGAGVWRMLSDYDNYFAAAMIVASIPRGISEKKVAKTPLCYVIGSEDDVVSPDATASIVKSLNKKKCDLNFEILQGKAHPETCRDAFTDDKTAWVLGHTKK